MPAASELSARTWQLAGAAVLAVSPGMVYNSRYFIHEMLFVFFTLGIVVAALRFYEGEAQTEQRAAGYWITFDPRKWINWYVAHRLGLAGVATSIVLVTA